MQEIIFCEDGILLGLFYVQRQVVGQK